MPGLSVAIAPVIGTIELGGLLAQHLNLSGWFWHWFQNINLNLPGFVIVGMFLRDLGDRTGDLAFRQDRRALECAPRRDRGTRLARPIYSV